jgi:hypothetical protein
MKLSLVCELTFKDDELGCKLQDAGIVAKLRAPKRLSVAKDIVEGDPSRNS